MPVLSTFELQFVSTGRVSLVRITSLRLEALQLDDQGSYDCRILLLDEPTDELQNGTWIVLSVTGEVYEIMCVRVSVSCLFVREKIIFSFVRQNR